MAIQVMFLKYVKYCIFFCAFYAVCHTISGQRTYATLKGFMMIRTHSGDSLFEHRYENISVLLDYDEANVNLNFELSDKINENVLSQWPRDENAVKIKASLSIPKIDTQPHPDQNFLTNGELFYSEQKYQLKGSGELKHHDGADLLACYLMVRLQPVDGIDLIIEPIGKIYELHLFQTVLNPVTLEEIERFER